MTNSEGVVTCRFCGIRLDLLEEERGGNHEKTCPEGFPPDYWESSSPKDWARKKGFIIYEEGENQ